MSLHTIAIGLIVSGVLTLAIPFLVPPAVSQSFVPPPNSGSPGSTTGAASR